MVCLIRIMNPMAKKKKQQAMKMEDKNIFEMLQSKNFLDVAYAAMCSTHEQFADALKKICNYYLNPHEITIANDCIVEHYWFSLAGTNYTLSIVNESKLFTLMNRTTNETPINFKIFQELVVWFKNKIIANAANFINTLNSQTP